MRNTKRSIVLLSIFFSFATLLILLSGCGTKPDEVIKKTCYSDRDCPVDYACQRSSNATNQDVVLPGHTGAEPTTRCAPGTRCGTSSSPVNPQPKGVCTYQPKTTGCYTNRDCRSDQICQQDADQPVPMERKEQKRSSNAPSGYPLPSGTCVDKPKPKRNICRSNRDCGADEVCLVTAKTGCSGATTNKKPISDRVKPAPACDPMPLPETGLCVKKKSPKNSKTKVTCTVTKRLSDGTVCKKCSDGTSMCSGSAPAPSPEPAP